MAFSIKRFGIAAVIFFLVFSAQGCRSASLSADFPRVPGSVLSGDIHGPFAGRVVDRGTGRPLAGATVVATWLYRRGVGSASPAGFVRYVGHTDMDGRYRIPSLRSLGGGGLVPARLGGALVPRPSRLGPGGLGVLTGVRILVYKRGYVAYRSDRVFPEGRPRLDFSQLDNKVRLEEMSDSVGRLAHVRFIGDIRALGADGTRELDAASDELAGQRPQRPQRLQEPIDLSGLLDTSDLAVLFGSKAVYRVGRLANMKRGPDSDSLHFEAVGKPQTYDLAIRLWRRHGSRSSALYRKLMGQYPGSRSVDQVGDHSFIAGDGHIFAHVFMDEEHGVVVSVTCGKDLCRDQASLLKVVQLVHDRLGRIDNPHAPGLSGPRLNVPGLPGKRSKPSYVPRLNQ